MSKPAEKLSSVNANPHWTTEQEHYQWIAESAYYKALARGFTPVRDQDDWLEAQKEYEEAMLKQKKNGLVSLR
ncbi:MAG: DUF2934 domain-containing protein [Methylovulum sp.]|nr:DUF2934 domain-containing protein [Methylovulum sp.]